MLGNDSGQFLAQLEAALARGDEHQVLELFDEEKYPALYNRLLDLLGQQGGDRETTKGGLPLPGIPRAEVRHTLRVQNRTALCSCRGSPGT